MRKRFKNTTSKLNPTRRTVLEEFVGCILLGGVLQAAPNTKRLKVAFPGEPLISVWEHSVKVDIAPVVRDVGFSTVRTHDKPCDSSTKREDTLMYRHMNTPGGEVCHHES